MLLKNNGKTIRTAAAAALCTVISAVFSFFFLTFFKLPVFWVLPATAAWVSLIRKTCGVKERRIWIPCAVFALLLSSSFVVGGKFRAEAPGMEPFYRSDFLYLAVLTAAFFVVLAPAAKALARRRFPSAPVSSGRALRPGAVWALCSVFFFLCWVPCLAVYYPGSISPDSLACITRALGKAGLSNQQPVFYTLLMRPFLRFGLAAGSLDLGCALFLLAQAAAMAAMLGYVPAWLLKKGAPLRAAVLCAAFFTLNPVFPMYAVTMWKDIPFAGVMVLYVLNLYDIVQSRGEWLRSRRNLVWFLALNLLIAFLRNNGFYVIAVTLVLLAVLYRKSWKRLVPGFLAVLAVVPVVQGPVYRLCGVAPSPFAESVGIPLQQVGYTVAHNGNVTEEQREFLGRMLPYEEIAGAYNPVTSNGIKFHRDFDDSFLEKNKAEFLRVWAEMLLPNFGSYIRAYIMETVGYWHVGTTGWWVLYYGTGDGYGAKEAGISLSASFGGPMVRSMRDNIKAGFEFFRYRMKPLSLMVNIGFLFWATAFLALLLALRKGRRYLLALLPLLLLWGTLMLAAPTFCEFRYMLAYAAAFPAVLAMPFLPGTEAAARRSRPNGGQS